MTQEERAYINHMERCTKCNTRIQQLCPTGAALFNAWLQKDRERVSSIRRW